MNKVTAYFKEHKEDIKTVAIGVLTPLAVIGTLSTITLLKFASAIDTAVNQSKKS